MLFAVDGVRLEGGKACGKINAPNLKARHAKHKGCLFAAIGSGQRFVACCGGVNAVEGHAFGGDCIGIVLIGDGHLDRRGVQRSTKVEFFVATVYAARVNGNRLYANDLHGRRCAHVHAVPGNGERLVARGGGVDRGDGKLCCGNGLCQRIVVIVNRQSGHAGDVGHVLIALCRVSGDTNAGERGDTERNGDFLSAPLGCQRGQFTAGVGYKLDFRIGNIGGRTVVVACDQLDLCEIGRQT